MRGPAPQAFSLTRRQNAAQVVEISRLAVGDFAEKSITNHTQDHHFVRAITTILQNDAVLASGFGGIDEIPALLQCCTGGDLDGSMFAILHGADCHGNVPVPRGGDVDDVEIELGQVLEIPFAVAEADGLCLACVRDRLLRSRHFLRYQVADRLDLYSFNCK